MKKTVWTESLLYKHKILADDVSVKSMIQNFTDKDAGNSLKVNSPYSLTKSIVSKVSCEKIYLSFKSTSKKYFYSVYKKKQNNQKLFSPRSLYFFMYLYYS